MTVNHYFQAGQGVSNDNELDLVERLIIEAIQINGQDFYYIPRTINDIDNLYQEDVMSSFNKYYTIEMYVDNIDSFGGQGNVLGKFGFELDDSVDLVVSRTRYFQETGEKEPQAGDLVFFPLTSRMFQVNWVSTKDMFYQLSKNHTFKLRCSTFTYSYEDMDTSLETVDDTFDAIEDKYSRNKDISDIADEVVDTSEDNPFWNENDPFGEEDNS